MWLVKKSNPYPGAQSTEIPAEDATALRAAYAGESSREQLTAALKLSESARRFDNWIACDCRQAEGLYPLLTPAYLGSAGTYYIRRLTGSDRPNHASDCIFRFERPVPGLGPIAEGRSAPIVSPTGNFSVLTPEIATDISEKSTTAPAREKQSKSVPPLARQLWRLMFLAGLTKLDPIQRSQKPSIKSEMSKLRVAAERLDVVDGSALASVLSTFPADYHRKALFAKIRQASKQWPDGAPLQGFLLAYTPDASGKKLLFNDIEPILVAGELARPVSDDSKARAPYLSLTVVGEHPSAGGLTALRSYAQPIYSGAQFIPVDSHFERQVLRLINKVRFRLAEERPSLEISIDKPVFDRMTEDGPCRPDFVLEIFDGATGEIRTLIVEAMGYKLPAYLEAKARTHPIMEKIAPVWTINPGDLADVNAVMRALSAAIDA